MCFCVSGRERERVVTKLYEKFRIEKAVILVVLELKDQRVTQAGPINGLRSTNDSKSV